MSDYSNPYLRRMARPQHGQKAEKRAAKRLGGKQTPGSGTQLHAKGDIVMPEFLVESKATKYESLSLKLDWLDKISREALAAGKEPAVIVQFVDAGGRIRRGTTWVLVPESVFIEVQRR